MYIKTLQNKDYLVNVLDVEKQDWLIEKSDNGDILKLNRIDYDSSGGKEVFLSYEDKNESIYGFLRLRKPSN